MNSFLTIRKTSIIILAILIAFSFLNTSCNKQEDRKIKFWHFWSEPNQQKVLKQIIAEFEKKHNCKVEITELSWNDGKTKLLAAFNSGTAPDVIELGSDWVAQFSSSGVLLPLSKDTMSINKFVEFSLLPSYWQSNLFAIPWVVDTRVLFYNKDNMKKAGLSDNPPATLDELVQYSQLINNPDAVYGFGANGSDPHRLYKKILPIIWTLGGDVIDNQGKLLLYSDANIKAFSTYITLARSGYLETQRQIDAAFTQGKITFWISGSWLLEKIKNNNPNLNYGVTLIPGIDSSKGISFAGGEYLAINSKSKNQELAKEFIKYITDGANSLTFCKSIAEAGFPADKNYYNDKYFQNQEYKKVFAEQLLYSKMTPVHPKWLEMEAIIENALVEAIYGKKSAQMALYDASRSINNLLYPRVAVKNK